MKHFNINDAEMIYETGDPDGYRAGFARIGPAIDAHRLGATIYELPPGQSHCPYHYEYGNEEWLIVLEGQPTVRHPQGNHDAGPGTIVCFAAGPAGAHKITNHSDSIARYLMLSTTHDPAVIVYPDSDKIAAYPGDARDNVIVTREHAHTNYWHGEM